MKNTGKAIGAIIFVIVIIGICIGSVIYAQSDYEWDAPWDFGWERGSAELRNTIELNTTENTDLSISYSSDNVNIYESDSDKLVVKEYLRDSSDRAKATASQNGDKISIVSGWRKPVIFSFWFTDEEHVDVYLPKERIMKLTTEIKSGNIDAAIPIEVPELNLSVSSGNMDLDVVTGENVSLQAKSGNIDVNVLTGTQTDIDISSGNVKVNELVATNTSCQAKSGNIELELFTSEESNLEVTSGNIKIDSLTGNTKVISSSGEIKIQKMTGNIVGEVKSGNIRVDSICGAADLRASSGNVDIEFSEIKGNINAETKSGNVKIIIPANSSFQFVGDTKGGNIDTSFDDDLSYDKEGEHAEGTVGSGAEYTITAYASSGNVSVR